MYIVNFTQFSSKSPCYSSPKANNVTCMCNEKPNNLDNETSSLTEMGSVTYNTFARKRLGKCTTYDNLYLLQRTNALYRVVIIIPTFFVVSDVKVAIKVLTDEAVTFMTMSDTNTSMWWFVLCGAVLWASISSGNNSYKTTLQTLHSAELPFCVICFLHNDCYHLHKWLSITVNKSNDNNNITNTNDNVYVDVILA